MTDSAKSSEITGVTFDPQITRLCRSGDNWSITWADDDNLYASCDDGFGWDYACSDERFNQSNNRVWRLEGGPDNLRPGYLPGFPHYPCVDQWYGYGILSVDSILYHFITCASDHEFCFPFRGAKLIYSPDHGAEWFLHNGVDAHWGARSTKRKDLFFWCETDEYAFANIEFLQAGKGYASAQDDYVYLYSPNGRFNYHQLNLARAPRGKILHREAYEFCTEVLADGRALWSPKIEDRGSIHEFPDNYGWYSWLPSVVYNEKLGLYIMANGGTGVDGSGMHDLPASMGIYTSTTPWGPWKEIFYTDTWVTDNSENRLYQPKLNPKWISEDGTEMYLIFSDASDKWGYQYRWNQQKLKLEV